MPSPDAEPPSRRARREPPTFRRVSVRRTERLSPRLVRVTVAGPELDGLVVEEPAASVRLLMPPAPGEELVLPAWTGNEFLLPDGSRPPIRTMTPRRLDPEAQELDLSVVLHGGGSASAWADAAAPGHQAAISGPARGYVVDPEARRFLLGGDESAIPAISQLLEAIGHEAAIEVHVEVARQDARLELPQHPKASVTWHDLPEGAMPGDAMVAAVLGSEIGPATQVWAAGEAAAVQRIRRHLFEGVGLPRTQAHVRGYWKHGRRGDDDA